MELEAIMAALAADLGVKDVRPDAGGAFTVSVDEMVVAFSENRASGELVTVAEVGEPPPGTLASLSRLLLEATFLGAETHGASFATSPGGEMVCLQRLDSLAAMDYPGFKRMLEDFVATLEKWRGIVADYREPGSLPYGERTADNFQTYRV